MYKILNTLLILGIWTTWVHAQPVFEKIDDDTIKITETKIEENVIDIKELNNRAIDKQSNIDYSILTCTEHQASLQAELTAIQFKISEAAKLGVEASEDEVGEVVVP